MKLLFDICSLSGVEMWKFFEFIVSVRTVIYPLVKPFLHSVLVNKNTDTEEEAIVQYSLRYKMHGTPAHQHKTQLLEDMADELDKHRADLIRTLGRAALPGCFD